MTFISTKVLIGHGLFSWKFFSSAFCWLILWFVLFPPIGFLLVTWKMNYAWWAVECWVVPCFSFYRIWHWDWRRHQMSISSYAQPHCLLLFWPYSLCGLRRLQKAWYTFLLSLYWVWGCWYLTEVSFSGYHLWEIYFLFRLPSHGRFTVLSFGVSPENILRLSLPKKYFSMA